MRSGASVAAKNPFRRPLFFTHLGKKFVFVRECAKKTMFVSSVFYSFVLKPLFAVNVCFKILDYMHGFSSVFALVFIIVLFYNINVTTLWVESQHPFFCLLKFALPSRFLVVASPCSYCVCFLCLQMVIGLKQLV